MDPMYFQLNFIVPPSCYPLTKPWCHGELPNTSQQPYNPKLSVPENHLQPFTSLFSLLPSSKPAIFNYFPFLSISEGHQVVILHSFSPVVLNLLDLKTCGGVVLWKYLLYPKRMEFCWTSRPELLIRLRSLDC